MLLRSSNRDRQQKSRFVVEEHESKTSLYRITLITFQLMYLIINF
jgi:hypothetical protein